MPIIRQESFLSTEFSESRACHPTEKSGFGFVTIAQKVASGTRVWQERSARLTDLPQALAKVGNGADIYMSQAAFASPNRRIVNLARVALLWVDLDTYNVPALAGIPPEHLVPLLLERCQDQQIPPPSCIISSGAGLYAKWYLTDPIPRRALCRWQLVQNVLCDRLAGFGADVNARDASRVLRVVDTIHAQTGRPVAVLWENTCPTHGASLKNGIVAHSFDVIADTLLPLTREELSEIRAERERLQLVRNSRNTGTGQELTLVHKAGNTRGLRPFVASQLAWDRFHDIEKLAKLRGWEHGAPAGRRDIPVFLAAAFMAQAVIVPNLQLEIAALARKFAPAWTTAEVQSCVCSVVARAEAASRGETIEYQGQKKDPRYWFKNQSLITLLDMSEDEERQMITIISPEESKRRDAERARAARKEAGAVERATYISNVDSRRSQAALLRGQGKSWQEVGDEMGVTATAARLLAKRADEKRSSPSVYM